MQRSSVAAFARRLKRPIQAAELRRGRLVLPCNAALQYERIANACARVYENAFSRRCGCVCVRSVCASAIPNPGAHVGMRGVCVRDR